LVGFRFALLIEEGSLHLRAPSFQRLCCYDVAPCCYGFDCLSQVVPRSNYLQVIMNCMYEYEIGPVFLQTAEIT
jgi:hypothetical protein